MSLDVGRGHSSDVVVIVTQISCGLYSATATTKKNTVQLNKNMA